jgi:hypothetical protein
MQMEMAPEMTPMLTAILLTAMAPTVDSPTRRTGSQSGQSQR